MKNYALTLPNDLIMCQLVVGSEATEKKTLKKIKITPCQLFSMCFIQMKYSIDRRVSCADVYNNGIRNKERVRREVIELRKMGLVESDNQYYIWLTVEGEALLADYFREVRRECKRLIQG